MKMLPQALRAALITTLTLLTASFLGGCQSYQLGHPAELPFKSIYIKPVANNSFAPQAQALLSSQIREAFIRDARTQLVTSEDAADAVLMVHLTEYDRAAASRQRSDTVVARDFDLTLFAEISLFDQNKGDYFFQNRSIKETSNAYVDNPFSAPGNTGTEDFLQAEYQAMPRLTRDLARKIADEVLSPWEPK